MDSEQRTLDLRSYLQILKRRRWIVAITFLSIVGAAALVSWRLTPIYQGVVQLEVQPSSGASSEASRVMESLLGATRALETQVQLIKSKAVLSRAAKELALPTTEELEHALSAELVGETQIVEIKVDHERPDEARDWANAVANAYIKFRQERILETTLAATEAITGNIERVQARITELEAQLQTVTPNTPSIRSEREKSVAQLTALQAQLLALPDSEQVQRGGGSVITAAETPDYPVRPKKSRTLALAILVGAIAGLALAFLAENLDDRVRGPEEIEQRVGAPVLGYIPYIQEWKKLDVPRLAIVSENGSGAAEAYRTLRTNLRFVSLGRPLKSILITSPVADVGKTTTAANLATALAEGGKKVILVSADLRKPTLHKFFGLTNSKGIVDALDPHFAIEQSLQSSKIGNLRLLAGGGLPPNPTEILASARFAAILKELEQISDLVVVDAPPVLGLGDSSALAAGVDGILQVLDMERITRRELTHATEQLRKAGGQLIGCVLNAVQAEQGYGYYYSHYYTQYTNDAEDFTEKPSLHSAEV